MEVEMICALQKVGVDTDTALRRFSSVTVPAENNLPCFPYDNNFLHMTAAKKAGERLHSLNGLSGAPGMTRIYEIGSATTALLSKGQTEAFYREICSGISISEARGEKNG